MDLEKIIYIHQSEPIVNKNKELCELCKKEPYTLNVFAFCYLSSGGGDVSVLLCDECCEKNKNKD